MSKNGLQIICIFEKMDERLTKKIVEEVFNKAKTKSASHSRYALSKQVESESRLSYRTLERAHNKFITETRDKEYTPNADSIDECCRYLGYQDYADYVSKKSDPPIPPKEPTPDSTKPPKKAQPVFKTELRFMGTAGLVLVCVAIIVYINYNSKKSGHAKSGACMTWNGNTYEKISCSKKPYSKYGTAIEPYDEARLKNFKRIEVDMATPFFAEETNNPLIWYYKTQEGTIEYYTAPGIHPVNGKTLKAITEYIIQKYVPMHKYQPSSFLKD